MLSCNYYAWSLDFWDSKTLGSAVLVKHPLIGPLCWVALPQVCTASSSCGLFHVLFLVLGIHSSQISMALLFHLPEVLSSNFTFLARSPLIILLKIATLDPRPFFVLAFPMTFGMFQHVYLICVSYLLFLFCLPH